MLRSTILFTALGTVVLMGCPPPPAPPEAPPPAPQIVAFSSSPETVKAGQSVTLSWETKNATKVELRHVPNGIVSGADALTGNTSVTAAADALYVLTASNDRGVRDSAAVWVDVDDGATEVVFIANPTTIRAGDPVVLAWNAHGASVVTLAPKGGANLDLGGQTASGSVTVRPAAETTYVLTVDGKALETTVGVLPSIDAFEVTPKSATPGEPLTVSWKTSAATKVTLKVGGDGVLVSETEPSRVADGTFEYVVPASISPAPVYTFTLTAEGANPKSADKKEVEVYRAGEPTVIQFNVPTYALTGSQFSLSWQTTGADEVQILRDGTVIYSSPSLTEADAGSFQIATPAADTKFQVRAISHRGGEALSDEKTVSPVGVPSVTSFTTNPQPGIALGGERVTLEWNVPNARNLKILVGGVAIHQATGVGAETGSIPVYPNNNTTYVLTADNGVAQAITPESRSVTVTTPATLVFAPNNVPVGSSIQITGTTAATTPVAYYSLDMTLKNAPGDAFIDISGTGTALPFPTDADTQRRVLTLSEPLLMNFNGVSVGGQKISVSVDGWLIFSDVEHSGASVVPDNAFPTDDFVPQAVVVFGEDLDMDIQSKILWQEDGMGAQRRVIVQWENVRICCTAAKRLTVQAQLYATGEVVLAYKDFPGLGSSDKGAMGVVNSDDMTAVGPTAAMLDSNGRPFPGDSFRMFGEITLPLTVTASNQAVKIVADMGDGRLVVEGTPTLLPARQFEFSEINYNPAAGMSQWFEIRNNTGAAIDLDGWTVDFGGIGNTLDLDSTTGTTLLPANGRLLFGQTADAAEGAATVDYVYGTTLAMSTSTGSLKVAFAGGVYAQASWSSAGTQGASLQFDARRNGLVLAANQGQCAGTAAYGTNGQLGTPGAANTICTATLPYALSSIPGAFQSILATGTQVGSLSGSSSTDSATGTITLTRPVNLLGVTLTQLHVSSNGFVSALALSNSATANKSVPSASTTPVGVLAPYWDDLVGNSTNSKVMWQQFDPDNTPASGDEYTIVSWENWKRYDSSGTGSLDFQVKLYEATGDVEFHYGTMTASNAGYASGSEATAWFEAPDGKSALAIVINQAGVIQPNSGYRFTAL